MVGRANNIYYLGRMDEAAAAYEEAARAHPRRAESPYHLAQVYFQKWFVPEAGGRGLALASLRPGPGGRHADRDRQGRALPAPPEGFSPDRSAGPAASNDFEADAAGFGLDLYEGVA